MKQQSTVDELRKFFGYPPLGEPHGSIRIEANWPDESSHMSEFMRSQRLALMHVEREQVQISEQLGQIFDMAQKEHWTRERWLSCTLDIVLEGYDSEIRSRLRIYQGKRPSNSFQLLRIDGEQMLEMAIKLCVTKSIFTLENFLKLAPEMNTLEIGWLWPGSLPKPEANLLVICPNGKASEIAQTIQHRPRWKNSLWKVFMIKFGCRTHETQLGKIRFLFVAHEDIDKIRGYTPDYAIDLQAGLRTEEEMRELGWLFCRLKPINEFMEELASFPEMVSVGLMSQREAHEESASLVRRMFKGWEDRARPSGVVVPALSQPSEGPRGNNASPSPE